MDSAPNRRRSAFASAFAALGFAFLALALYYALSGLSADTWDYSLPRRIKVLAGISLVAVSVGMSAVVFQTVAANHILTPGIMGLDSLYGSSYIFAGAAGSASSRVRRSSSQPSR